ncbi:MAG: DUF3606 domain-containing protein [Bacteroidia bacterium]
MNNTRNKIHSPELLKINIRDQEELDYWMKTFQCTREELYEAVTAVGPSPAKVEKFLTVNEQYELEYWARKLNCSTEKLKQAVNYAGNSLDKIEKALRSVQTEYV